MVEVIGIVAIVILSLFTIRFKRTNMTLREQLDDQMFETHKSDQMIGFLNNRVTDLESRLEECSQKRLDDKQPLGNIEVEAEVVKPKRRTRKKSK
jgi:hypothetical protein